MSEFGLETIIEPELRESMSAARAQATRTFGKVLNFYITSDMFPSISITGSRCSLQCKHCGGKLLERLIPCSDPRTLVSIAHRLEAQGAKGLLITGGCNTLGQVPVVTMAGAIREIKGTTDLKLIAHTGFISEEEVKVLCDSGLDGIGFDVVGDMGTARRVYGLDIREIDYISSIASFTDSGMQIFPHVCVGLDGGRLRGEFNALAMIQGYPISTLVITGLMPVKGTYFSHVKPDPLDFARVISKAVEMFRDIPITLGCARSSGRDRALIDQLAIESGVLSIAIPTQRAVEYALGHGYSAEYYGTCCGLLPSADTRIPEVMV